MPRKYTTLKEDLEVAEAGKPITKYISLPWNLSERALKQAKRMGDISLSAYIRMAVVKFTESMEKEEREAAK